jgi:molybdenum cofactor cytidylyltransferase
MNKMPTAGIILAAGSSSRLGRTKQLLEIDGQILLAKTISTALASKLDRVVLVLGHESDRILAALGDRLKDHRIMVTVNERYREGMSSSLQHALLMVRSAYPSIMVILADHPFLDAGTIDLLLDRFRDSDKDICVPCFRGRQGVPVSLSSRFYKDVMNIRGDIGARNIVRENPECTIEVEIENGSCFVDIDNEEDYEAVASALLRK